jgi:7-carboxy-7-deazaguanine synthase
VQALASELDAPPEKIVLMPEGISADILSERGVWVTEICKRFGYRFSPRLHVYLWGNQRGV